MTSGAGFLACSFLKSLFQHRRKILSCIFAGEGERFLSYIFFSRMS